MISIISPKWKNTKENQASTNTTTQKESGMKYFNEAKYFWQTYVPKQGQAETVQGELIRAIEKLRGEAQRNGNINWDKGFVI